MRLGALVCLALDLALALSPPLAAQPVQPRRLALVVGNVDYVNHTPLPNVASDVASVREKLTEMGFDVVSPPQRGNMDDFTTQDLVPFAARIRPGDIVVFYYSGHGFSYGGDNYIVPVGVDAQVVQSDVQFTFPAESSIRSFLQQRRPAFLLMLMDACRSRPGFVRDGVSSGTEKGYTMPQRPPEDVSITSAVAPGYTASAGAAGMKSVFTEALAANMAVPGRELSVLQGKIAYQMRQAGAQDPWVSENRVTRLWLQTSPAVDEEARVAWEDARASASHAKVAEYLAWYATGPYAAEARKWLDDNPEVRIATPVAVAPLNADLAWQDAVQSSAVATAAAYDGLQVGRVQSLGMDAVSAAQLRRDLAVDPLAMNSRALATKSLANGSIKRGALVDLTRRAGDLSSTSYYSAMLGASRRTVQLGRPKTEGFLAPDPEGSGATVRPEQVASLLAAARAGGARITWVSLATSRGPRPVTVASGLMATRAAALMVKSGIPASQVTTVEGVPESFEGVRARIFAQ